MNLTKAQVGSCHEIKAIWGNDEIICALKEYNIQMGVRVLILVKLWGAIVLEIRNQRITIGEELASKIII